MRRPFRPRCSDCGFALIAILTLLIAGALAFLVTTLGPEAMEAYRKHKTEAALAEAREALIGYTTKYRDVVAAGDVYGFLPMPDLGTSHNNNGGSGCNGNVLEGCDAANFSGNANSITVIGRFPWRLLGTAPLRDGQGECLWLIVSGSHQRIQQTGTMNWDTPGQVDVVVANGATTLSSALASPHDRPVAIIFSPGQMLPGQDRSNSAVDEVTECGGNYNVKNYLDPASAAVQNYFDGAAYPSDGVTNNAFGDTSAIVKAIAASGSVFEDSDGKLWPNDCPSCTLAANDRALAIAPDTLFGAIRKSSGFRTDINSMLDRMVGCLRDYIVAGVPGAPVAIPGYAPPADKSAGRVPDFACYSAAPPLGYFSHWRDMVFVAGPTVGSFNVTVDGVAQPCAGVLIFAGQRGAGQSRTDLAEQSLPANYLEGVNLASFTAPGTAFAGPSQLSLVSGAQSAQQDIVRCIPATSSMETVNPPTLTDDDGNVYGPMSTYDPASRTLTLGSEAATTVNDVDGGSLFGCAWTPEVDTRGKGFRAYFAIRFMAVTGGVGNNGIVFAAVDGETNGTNVCGAAGSHLGYSGDNGVTPPLSFPKIGIEFDQGRNSSSISSALNSGRNDPDRTYSCSGTPHSFSYYSHSAVVYWGDHGLIYDDNVHGFPTSTSATRPDPRNPSDLCATPPGIAFVNYRGEEDVNGDGDDDSYLYHVRVEVTPTRTVNASAELSNTTFVTKAWIRRDSVTDAQIIAAMRNTTRPMAQLYPTATQTIADTAVVYDVSTGTACGGGCPTNQTCGTDNVCYRQGLKSVRLGFTGSQLTRDQQVLISNFFTSWLQ